MGPPRRFASRVIASLVVLAACVSVPALASDGYWQSYGVPPSNLSPGSRDYHTAVYDSLRDRMILIGGNGAAGQPYWQLAITPYREWEQLSTAGNGPGAVIASRAVLDTRRDRILVIGGLSYPSPNGPLNTVWALPLTGSAVWGVIPITGPLLPARYAHCAVYDPVRDRVLVFGGYTGSEFSGELWALSLGSSPTWTRIAGSGSGPPGRDAAGMIYDPVGDRLVLFGGWSGSDYLNDVWVYPLSNSSGWTALVVEGMPPEPMRDMSAVYDPINRRMLVYGGSSARRTSLYESYALWLDGIPRWSTLAGYDAGDRYAHTAVYDSRERVMLVNAGARGSGPFLLSDTWSCSVESAVWEKVASRRPSYVNPPGRFEHAGVYDRVVGRTLILGGREQGPDPKNDLWELEVNADPPWKEVNLSGPSPVARIGQSAIFDGVGRRTIAFGGTWYDGSGTLVFSNDASVSLAGDPGTWEVLSPLGVRPTGRTDHAAAYDSRRRRMLVHGGSPTGDRDIWALWLNDPPRWEKLTTSGTRPPALAGHSAVYDSAGDQVFLYGGTDTRGNYFSGLWRLRLSGTPTWELVTGGTSAPPPISSHAAVVDSRRHRMLLFGGWRYSSPTPYATSDLWELSLDSPNPWRLMSPSGPPPQPRADLIMTYDESADVLVLYGGRMTQSSSTTVFSDTWILRQDAVVAVTASVVRAAPGPEGVDLEWAISDAARATLYRSDKDAGWSPIATLTTDGVGHVSYRDSDVASGRRYGYRLGLPDGAGETLAGEVWVTRGTSPVLRIWNRGRNPSEGRIALGVELPDAALASLELLDVGGRVIESREIGALGPGAHMLTFGRAGLASGVYFVRIRRVAEDRSLRVVVVR